MFSFKYVLELKNLVYFWTEKTGFFYTVWVIHPIFCQFIMKLRVYSEEILKLDILPVAANLYR